jgi:hypothetical protein
MFGGMKMKEYHKIQTLFKRDLDAPGKPMIEGEWTNPDLEYLADNLWEFTEKVDGTNIRIEHTWARDRSFWYDTNIGGRTDNAQIPAKLVDYLRHHFSDELFKNAGLELVTLYGEGYGAGIQKGGGNYLPNQEFVLFDVVVHGEDQDWWLERKNVNDIAQKLNLASVPVIGYGTLHDAIDMVKSGLRSQWGDFEAEGIVARPKVQLWNRKGERIITKIKGRDFK